MKNNFVVHYDKEGDLLEIRIGKPTKSHMKDLGNDVFQRIDEKTGQVKGFAIFNFKKRTERKDLEFSFPLESKIDA